MRIAPTSAERFDRLEQRLQRLAAELRALRRATAADPDAAVRFALGEGLFVANRDPDLVGNICTCLAHAARARVGVGS